MQTKIMKFFLGMIFLSAIFVGVSIKQGVVFAGCCVLNDTSPDKEACRTAQQKSICSNIETFYEESCSEMSLCEAFAQTTNTTTTSAREEVSQETSVNSSSATASGKSKDTIPGVTIGGIFYPSGTKLPDNPEGVSGVLKKIINWLLGIVGTLAILIFIVSGIKYIVSVGDTKEAESAKKIMTFAIIGLVVALSGLIVVNTIDSILK